jgi:penicillin-binding protein 2
VTLQHNSPGRDLKARYLYLGAAMLAGLVVLAGNLYRLQIVHGDEYLAKSQENFIKPVRVRADRGMIKDRRGEILADGRPSFDVFVTPAFCQRCAAEVLPRLATYLKWDDVQQARVEATVKATRGPARFTPIAVKVDLTRDELDVLNAHPDELPGVDLVAVPHRNYRTGTVLAHVLGYMNEVTQEELDSLNAQGGDYALGDYLGRRGIERYFENQLRGLDGQRKEVVNARGQSMRDSDGLIAEGDEVPPKPGKNVILSIDSRLQAEAEKVFPGVAGAVVALDVRTGFILAMVSRPSYDPNVLTGRVSAAQMSAMAKDPLQPMMFRPVAMHYSPGSTFKPITMLAGLKSGQFNAHSFVNCTGGYRLGARTWRCWADRGHGIRDSKQALQSSCDTYFYKVADTIGLDPIAEMGRALGLGAPTGIAVVGEVPGIMPDVAYHDRVTPGGYQKGMALNSAIGQGDDNLTPLQLTLAYAAIANGGTLYQPQLVRRIEAADGQVLQEFQPKVVRQVPLNPEHRQLVVDALVSVVNEAGGTATRVRLKNIIMAGKTGTAQVQRIGAVREKKEQMDYFERDHAWFAAFAPAEDPEIAVVVLNEHAGHGGVEAAPTAAAVIQKYFDLKKSDASASVRPAPAPLPPTNEVAPPAPPSLTPPTLSDEARRKLAASPPGGR